MIRREKRTASRMYASSDNTRAAIYMLVSMGGFFVNDTCVKLAAADLPPAQIMGVRGIAATAILYVVARATGSWCPLRRVLQPMIGIRTSADILSTITYITALAHLPLANASAIYQALPLVVTLGAAIFFKEAVGWRRWSAILVGFVGVLVIVKPGTVGFTIYSFPVLASVAFAAARDLATRCMDKKIPSVFVAFVTAAAVCVTGWIILIVGGEWKPMTPVNIAYLGVATCGVVVGYIFIVQAMRVGEMGFVAPFRYSVLIFAIIGGVFVFAEIPAMTTLVGSALVITSGLYSLHRERRRRAPVIADAQIH